MCEKVICNRYPSPMLQYTCFFYTEKRRISTTKIESQPQICVKRSYVIATDLLCFHQIPIHIYSKPNYISSSSISGFPMEIRSSFLTLCIIVLLLDYSQEPGFLLWLCPVGFDDGCGLREICSILDSWFLFQSFWW